MTLADWADVATISASILAVLGIGWLVFVQIRRHRRFQQDYEFLCKKIRSSVDAKNEAIEEALNELKQVTQPSVLERIELIGTCIGGQLDGISSDLQNLQLIAMADYLRQQDADEEVTSLLANWKFRSPITRRK